MCSPSRRGLGARRHGYASNIPCMISSTHCWDEAPLLALDFIGRASLGADLSAGGTSTASGTSSRRDTACLASLHSRNWSWAVGRMRSEATFQWFLDGGLRVIAIFGLWKKSVGISSGVYSNNGAEVSLKSQGKPTWQISSPPGCPLQRVWSRKPLSWTGAGGSLLTSNISLLATSNRTGCCSAIGITLLTSDGFTNRSLEEVILSSNADWEPALCHSFKCM